MTAVLSRALLPGIVLLLIWALVLGWWRATGYQPTVAEALLYLLALPFALLFGYWLLDRFVTYVRAPAPAAAPTDTTPQASDAPPPAPWPALAIARTALATAVGDDAADVTSAVASGKRPPLDNELMDADGFPVFVARHPLADDHTGRDDWPTEQARTLRLLEQVIEQIARPDDMTTQAEHQPVPLYALWLHGFGPGSGAEKRLHKALEARLAEAFPDDDITFQGRSIGSDADALVALNDLVDTSVVSPDSKRLVIAGVSHVGETTVQRWDAAGQLFGAERQDGSIPGEAAAALLLETPGDDDARPRLGEVWLEAEATPRKSRGSTAVNALLARAIAQAPIQAVVSDTDHRADAQQALLVPLTEHLTDLDPVADCTALGAGCGSLAPIGSLVALACASALSLEKEQPVLCVSNQHPINKAAVCIAPPSLETHDQTA